MKKGKTFYDVIFTGEEITDQEIERLLFINFFIMVDKETAKIARHCKSILENIIVAGDGNTRYIDKTILEWVEESKKLNEELVQSRIWEVSRNYMRGGQVVRDDGDIFVSNKTLGIFLTIPRDKNLKIEIFLQKDYEVTRYPLESLGE